MKSKLLNILAVLAILGALILPLIPYSVLAAPALIDSYNTGDDDYWDATSTTWRGQTFTLAANKDITSIKFLAERGTTIGTVTLVIRDTTGNVPSGANLASGTADGSAWNNAAYEWHEITLSSAFYATSGHKYAFAVYPAASYLYVRGDGSSPSYSGGTWVYSTDSGSTWDDQSSKDLMFEIWGQDHVVSPPSAPTGVSATDGTYGDKVVVTWTKSSGATDYHVWRGASDLGATGDVATFNDTGAGAPSITAGAAVATDGTYSYVGLSLTGSSISDGSSGTYKVIASNSGGSSGDSNTDTGYRGGTLTYQWQMSAADSDASYSDISGATTASYHCTTAPTNGDKRYFKCVESAGAVTATSTANEGYRTTVSDTFPTPVFSFVQMTDTDIDSPTAAGVITSAAVDINKMSPQPAFTIFTGDIVSLASTTLEQYAKTNMAGFIAPVYTAIGEKDDSNGNKTIYENLFGARNYAFTSNGYNIIVLDSTKPNSVLTYGGGFMPDTVTWLTHYLTTISTSTPLIVVTHHSFWSPMTYQPRVNLFNDVENSVLSLFTGYNLVQVVSGHADQSMQYTYNGIQFNISAGMNGNGTANVDISAAGYTIYDVYTDHIEAHWIPLGSIDAYYNIPKANVVTVGQSSGDYVGSTSAAIQSAISAVHTSYGGGTVFIKSGTYTLVDGGDYSTPIVAYSNTWIVGSDRTAVTLQFQAGASSMKGIAQGTYDAANHIFVNNIRISNITIDGNKANCPDGTGATHVWYNGIAFDGNDSIAVGDLIDADYTHDIVIDKVDFKDFWQRAITGYVARRWSVRNCTYYNAVAAVGAEDPNDFWQIENNTTDTVTEPCTGDNMSNALVYRNDFGNIVNTDKGTTPVAFQPWCVNTHWPVTNNHFVYNYVHDSTALGTGMVDLAQGWGTSECTNNTFTNIVTSGSNAVIRINEYNNNGDTILGGNTFTNSALHEWYTAADSSEFWSPTGLAFTSSAATTATMQASGGYYVGSSPYSLPPTNYCEYEFQKAEFDGTNINLTTAAHQVSNSYTFGSLNDGYSYTFRVRSYYSGTLYSGWSEWISLSAQLTNHKPVLASIGNKSVRDGGTLTFVVSATDQDGNSLTYSASNLPSGANFNAGTKTFSWTPSGQLGNYTAVHFVVTDGTYTVFENITISVTNIKAMVAWGITDTLLTSSAERTKFLSVCQTEKCNEVYLQYSATSYLSFITAAKALGIKTFVMIGGEHATTDWATLTTLHTGYIQTILTYNIANPSYKIDGIFWDIESTDDTDLSDYGTYIDAMQAVTVSSQTIVTQSLTKTIYVVLYNTVAGKAFAHKFDRIDIDGYADLLHRGTGLDLGVVGRASSVGADICEAESIPFTIGLETDELDFANEHTNFADGKDGYHDLETQVDIYYTTNYSHFVGQYLSHYQSAVEAWNQISVSSFTYQGQIVNAAVTIKDSDNYQTSTRGLSLQVKDTYGNIYESTYLKTWTQLQSRNLTFIYTLPAGVNLSTSTARIITYDIDKRGSSRNPVNALWATNYSILGLNSNIENNTLTQYTTAVKVNPSALGGYGRQDKELVIMDYTSWSSLTEGEVTTTTTTTTTTTSTTTTGTTGTTTTGGSTTFNYTSTVQSMTPLVVLIYLLLGLLEIIYLVGTKQPPLKVIFIIALTIFMMIALLPAVNGFAQSLLGS